MTKIFVLHLQQPSLHYSLFMFLFAFIVVDFGLIHYPCAGSSGNHLCCWFLVPSIHLQLHTSFCQLANLFDHFLFGFLFSCWHTATAARKWYQHKARQCRSRNSTDAWETARRPHSLLSRLQCGVLVTHDWSVISPSASHAVSSCVRSTETDTSASKITAKLGVAACVNVCRAP